MKHKQIIPKGYVQRVAKRIGMTPQSISNINTGKTHKITTILKAKKALRELLAEDQIKYA